MPALLDERLPASLLGGGLEGRTLARIAQVQHTRRGAFRSCGWLPVGCKPPDPCFLSATLRPITSSASQMLALPPPLPPPQYMEHGVEAVCLFACFRGIRAGKSLMQARRAQRRAARGKKDD